MSASFHSILYREPAQRVLADCLDQPAIVREIYDLAVETLTGERKHYFGLFIRSPESVLYRSVQVLEFFVGMLRRLRRVAEEQAGRFRSEGFTALFEMLAAELDDAYFQEVEDHLRRLRFRDGALISVRLGRGLKGADYVLRRPHEERPGWRRWLPDLDGLSHTIVIPDRDENGHRALSDLRGRGLNLVANALARSNDHIKSFLALLRAELGFYVACLNLHERFVERGQPMCVPEALAPGRAALSARGLYDPCLALTTEEPAVGNDVAADGRLLVVITGANQGGKSTFLRGVGLAHLMMQCGMPAPAESFAADARDRVLTHFKREEDATMESGKLDEELSRMSEVADSLTPRSLLLCNESFSSTNEREGSEIARQIVRALLEAGVKVLFVTHLFDLAQGFHAQGTDTALFLRAERREDGRRTFKLVEGEPLPTSYGQDLYERIFGAAARTD